MNNFFGRKMNCKPLIVGLFFIFFLLAKTSCAQSLGDPVVSITFGSGTAVRGPALAADSGSTTYTYTNGEIGENYYTITNLVNTAVHSGFVTSTDHTGNTGGYMMVVNGNLSAGTVFTRKVSGLCGTTSYQFGVWIKNVLASGGILPNMIFHIYAEDGVTELGSGVSTGDVPSGNVWHNYTANFTLPAGTGNVIIKLVSNASGQQGNDFAVDDITFRPYGSTVAVAFDQTTATSQTTCAGTSKTYTVNVTSTLANGYVQKLQAYINGVWVDQGLPSTATSFTITPPTVAETYPYRLVSAITDNINSVNCVVASNQLTLVVTAGPTAIIGAVDNTCLGTAIAFTDQSTSNGGTINQWTWDFGDGTTSTAQNPSHAYATAGKYTVSLTVGNSNGCTSSTATKDVDINTVPTSKFSFSVPNCETKPITFTDLSTAGSGSITSWIWDYGDGTIDTKSDNQQVTHTYTLAGTYSVKLTVTTDKNCSSISSLNLIVNPLPKVDFITPSICQSDGAANFTNASSIADNSSLNYLWNFGDPNATIARPNTSAAVNPAHFYSQAGTYTVTLTVTSNYNCPVTLSKTFTINGSNPKAVLLPANSMVCSNRELILTNQSTVDPGSITKIEIYYEYGIDNSVMETFVNPTFGQVFRHTYPVFHSGSAKNYTIHMLAFSGATNSSCTGTTDVAVQVLPVADLNFPALETVCQNNGLVQLNAKENSGLAGTWKYIGTGVTNTETGATFDPAISGAGTFTINYIFSAINACADTVSQIITVNSVPIVNVGPDITVLEGGTAPLPAAASGDNLTYLWSPATNLSNPNVLNPMVSPSSEDLTYTLTVSTELGCSTSGKITVYALKAPVVPTAFSPNGDGVNDTWNIKYLDTYNDCVVEVFNRYGTIVYYSTGYPLPWDGKSKNIDLPVGVYYYLINPKHERKIISGSITILR